MQIVAEYDTAGVIIWMAPQLGYHLGINPLMAAGEYFKALLPFAAGVSFEQNLIKLLNQQGNVKIMRLVLPSLTGAALRCYHLPTFDPAGNIQSFKIVADI